jgi:hypothetical protein
MDLVIYTLFGKPAHHHSYWPQQALMEVLPFSIDKDNYKKE